MIQAEELAEPILEVKDNQPASVPPISTFHAVREFRTEHAAITKSIEEVRNLRAEKTIAKMAILAAIVGLDYPADKNDPQITLAWRRHAKLASQDQSGKEHWVIDPDIVSKHKNDAILVLELALATLNSAELSAVALHKTGQAIPGNWNNLHAIDLAQKVNERAVQYYRGRLFE